MIKHISFEVNGPDLTNPEDINNSEIFFNIGKIFLKLRPLREEG